MESSVPNKMRKTPDISTAGLFLGDGIVSDGNLPQGAVRSKPLHQNEDHCTITKVRVSFI